MKFFGSDNHKTSNANSTKSLNCLFQKHAIKQGKITVNNIEYWDWMTLKTVYISFHITADMISHKFSTNVPFKSSQQEVLDTAFNKIYDELDKWLEIAKDFHQLKTTLQGQVVFNWEGASINKENV